MIKYGVHIGLGSGLITKISQGLGQMSMGQITHLLPRKTGHVMEQQKTYMPPKARAFILHICNVPDFYNLSSA